MNSKVYILLIISSLLIFSCKKEKVKGCTNSEATNFNADAELDDGSCTFIRDKYLGNYSGIKICQIYPSDSAFSCSISASTASGSQIFINQFPESGVSITANLDFGNTDKIIIPNQTIENALDISDISGSGILSGNQLTISYYRTTEFGTIDTSSVTLTQN